MSERKPDTCGSCARRHAQQCYGLPPTVVFHPVHGLVPIRPQVEWNDIACSLHSAREVAA